MSETAADTLERVARAIHGGIQAAAEKELTARGAVYPKPLAFDDLSDEVRNGYRETARAAIAATMPKIVDLVIDAAEQACRYALKHQNFGAAAREDDASYVEGFAIGCEVCEGAIRRHVEGKLVMASPLRYGRSPAEVVLSDLSDLADTVIERTPDMAKGRGDGSWTERQWQAAWDWLVASGYTLVPAATDAALQVAWRSNHPGRLAPELDV